MTTAYSKMEIIVALPDGIGMKFRVQVMDAWDDDFFPDNDFRWATVWMEEDGTWVVHVNENPGGYYVGEWRLPPGAPSWQDVEGGEYDWDAQQRRIDSISPRLQVGHTFKRGDTAYYMPCVSWNREDEGRVVEVTVVKACDERYYNCRFPDGLVLSCQRWANGEYPTDLFTSREEAEALYARVKARRKEVDDES